MEHTDLVLHKVYQDLLHTVYLKLSRKKTIKHATQLLHLLAGNIFIWKIGNREARVETKVPLARWKAWTSDDVNSHRDSVPREETRPQHMGKNVSWRVVPLATPILFITHLKSFGGSPVWVLVQPVPRFPQFWPVSLAWFLFPYDISEYLYVSLASYPLPGADWLGEAIWLTMSVLPLQGLCNTIHTAHWEVTALLPTLLRTKLYLTTLF